MGSDRARRCHRLRRKKSGSPYKAATSFARGRELSKTVRPCPPSFHRLTKSSLPERLTTQLTSSWRLSSLAQPFSLAQPSLAQPSLAQPSLAQPSSLPSSGPSCLLRGCLLRGCLLRGCLLRCLLRGCLLGCLLRSCLLHCLLRGRFFWGRFLGCFLCHSLFTSLFRIQLRGSEAASCCACRGNVLLHPLH